MPPSHLTGVFFALIAAALYGAGDFCGGVASRRHHVVQVLLLASFSSVILLGVLIVVLGETVPPARDLLWAGAAGTAGALGLAALYRALAMGDVALVAPTAGVIGAGLPVVWGAFTEGLPGTAKLLGFVAAVFGIWFVTRSEPSSAAGDHWRGLALAVFAGIAFGGYFILLAQMDGNAVLIPQLVAKVAAACLCLLFIALYGLRLPALESNPLALLAGVLDGIANVIYLLAKHNARLDVAVVLTSLYPAVTVVLACLLLRARIAGSQWIGVLLCLGAIALIVA